jgi:flagellar basal body-associated protein FliL
MDFGHTGSKHRKKQILIGLVGVVIACVAAAAIYFFYKYDQASQPQLDGSNAYSVVVKMTTSLCLTQSFRLSTVTGRR